LRVSFIQVPSNIPRFYEILNKDNSVSFVSVEDVIRNNIHHLFRNIEIGERSIYFASTAMAISHWKKVKTLKPIF